jgi:hypothetical protein
MKLLSSRTFSAVAVISLVYSAFSGCVLASDWVEDETSSSMAMPRAAPPRQRNSGPIVNPNQYSQAPPVAPPMRKLGDDQSSDSDSPTFYVKPGKGANQPLQANIKKWGEADEGKRDYLQGSASALQVPLRLQKPTAISAPPQMFRGWLEQNHPAFALATSAQASRNLVEIKGAWDDSSTTLRALGIRHQTIKGGALRDYPLDGVKVMVINCPGKVPVEALQKIRNFVAGGGFLLSTDWALENVVQRAFPGYVAYNDAKASQTMVDATVQDLDPVLFKGGVTRAYWKVDDGSELVRVLKPQAVRVLVTSSQLSNDDPDHRGILAVNFAFGKGQVLHLVGHFDNNAGFGFRNTLPDPAPGIGISLRQAMATNFIVEGLSR